ncbi:MAG: adenylyl-sulfate kinase [Rhodospirillaceae bacterium]
MTKFLKPYPIVVVGHVDHGKSTLIGRLLHDSGKLGDGKADEIHAASKRRNREDEFAFALDSLRLERDQGITVDTSRVWFKTEKRPYVIIDAPGHFEFVRNMVTGAHAAEGAVLVVDIGEGISEQTRRHAFLLTILGISKVIVAVNKMDMVKYDEAKFKALAGDINEFLSGIGITPIFIIPISAKAGLGVAHHGDETQWFAGPSILEGLDLFPEPESIKDAPFRMSVQDVYKEGDNRIAVGRIDAGSLRVGDAVVLQPSGRVLTLAKFQPWSDDTSQISATAGQSVALNFEQAAFVQRGDLLVAQESRAQTASSVQAQVFWLHVDPLNLGDVVNLRLGAAKHEVVVTAIDSVVDLQSLENHDGNSIPCNGVATVTLVARSTIVFDTDHNSPMARAVLSRDLAVAGGALIVGPGEKLGKDASQNLTPVPSAVARRERSAWFGHKGGVFWFTGLSGSGKSTIASLLERRLFDLGVHTIVLDGDSVRNGLNQDLGFSEDDRTENLRRVAHVARLMSDNGSVVITSFIAPAESDRQAARSIIGENFHEVYVKASVDTCEQRDPKGLYKKARLGEISDFTGVSADYDPPKNPEIILDTEMLTVEAAVDHALRHILDAVDHVSVKQQEATLQVAVKA